MKKIKNIGILMGVVIILVLGIYVISNSPAKDNKVVIYSAAEDIVNQAMLAQLKTKFPKYDIILEYMSSGSMATKIAAEKTETIIDIAYDLEFGSIGLLSEYFEDLEYDKSKYSSEFITDSRKYVPVSLSTNAIVVNSSELEKKGIEIPKSYKDLLKPEYKNLIAMPNPTVSGTGYIFLKSLVNAMGEEEAYKYFDSLSTNLLEFTSSGLGPVSMLERGEIEVAMGQTAAAARSITAGYDFKIIWFDEGAPYTFYAMSVIKGRLKKPAVKKVYEYIEEYLNDKVNKECFVESIYKVVDYQIPNYPDKVPFADMRNYTFKEKERLLNKWKH